MSQFAKDTSVSVEKTQTEIRQTLRRYGAEGFAMLEHTDHAVIGFTKGNRSVRFDVPMPSRKEERFTHYGTGVGKTARVESAAHRLWEQACRQRWRALALGIKAKLEFIESGITTFEEEFFAHIVTKAGPTIYQIVLPQLEEGARTKPLSLLDR